MSESLDGFIEERVTWEVLRDGSMADRLRRLATYLDENPRLALAEVRLWCGHFGDDEPELHVGFDEWIERDTLLHRGAQVHRREGDERNGSRRQNDR